MNAPRLVRVPVQGTALHLEPDLGFRIIAQVQVIARHHSHSQFHLSSNNKPTPLLALRHDEHPAQGRTAQSRKERSHLSDDM